MFQAFFPFEAFSTLRAAMGTCEANKRTANINLHLTDVLLMASVPKYRTVIPRCTPHSSISVDWYVSVDRSLSLSCVQPEYAVFVTAEQVGSRMM
jgi:hypothetical protein